MPTFRNVSSQRKEVAGKVVEPTKEFSSLVYYDENNIGLLKVSDYPMFNPILLSDKYTVDTVIIIPKIDNLKIPVTKYAIHFCVQVGEVEIFYNSADNLPSLKLYPGGKWNIRSFERTLDKIIVRGNGLEFLLYVIIEKI